MGYMQYYAILYIGTRASSDFGTHGGPGTSAPTTVFEK